MMRLTTTIAALVATGLLTACAGGWWPFGGSSSQDPSARIPPGATVYNCAGNKRLFVRHASDGKSAWVIYPDREFRLDRVAASSGDRYSNGVSTLTIESDEATLDEGGARLFSECKRS
jgi:membrane-bound inhibitor of C-type lysozyme